MSRNIMKKILSCAFFVSALLVAYIFFTRSDNYSGLPKPTGPFAIGTTSYHLVDKSRKEQLSPNPDDLRELLVQVWYPAQLSGKEQVALYARGAEIGIKEMLALVTEKPTAAFAYLATLKSNSYLAAPIAPSNKPYPVLIFSSGGGGPAVTNSALIENLASHGYVVVGMNYTYSTHPVAFPDGRIIRGVDTISKLPTREERHAARGLEQQKMVDDIAFVISELTRINQHDDQNILTGALDLDHIGIFGHSFGGSTSTQACRDLPQCKAGVNIDGRLWTTKEPTRGFNKPFMFIVAPHSDETLNPLRALYAQMTAPAYYTDIKDVDHFSFADFYVIASGFKELPKLSTEKALALTRELLVAFFDRYLKKNQAADPTKLTTKYQELKIKYHDLLVRNT